MICPNCGRGVPEGMQCGCGTPGAGRYSSNPAVNLIKAIGASRLFLGAAVCFTISVVFSLLSSLKGAGNMSEVYRGYFPGDYDITSMVAAGKIANTIGICFGSVNNILLAAAIWHFHHSCKNVSTGGVHTGGLSVLKVLTTILLVLICIVCGLLVVVFLLGLPAYLSQGAVYGVNFGVMLVAGMITIAIVSGFMISYLVSLTKTIGNIRATCQTGALFGNVSLYLAVVNCIIGGIDILYAIMLIKQGIPTAVGMIFRGAALFLFSQMLFHYRRGVGQLLYQQLAAQGQIPFHGYGSPGDNGTAAPVQHWNCTLAPSQTNAQPPVQQSAAYPAPAPEPQAQTGETPLSDHAPQDKE